MQCNLVNFVGKRCKLVQVWVGGSGNGGKGEVYVSHPGLAPSGLQGLPPGASIRST